MDKGVKRIISISCDECENIPEITIQKDRRLKHGVFSFYHLPK